MRLTRLFAIALLALGVSLAAPTAHAVTFTFAETGSLTPAGFSSCFSSGDRCGSSLVFSVGSVIVTASGSGASRKAVIQDRNPVDGGLGVVNYNGATFSGDDEVDSGETLVLTFNQSVFLNAATFFDKDHDPLGATRTFNFGVDGPAFASHRFSDPFANAGTTFYFQFGGDSPKDFYLASVGVVEPVPEPGTLLLLGSGVLGLAGRARRRRRS